MKEKKMTHESLVMVVINEAPSRGMKRIHEFENFDYDKELLQIWNTRHSFSPSNPNLPIFLFTFSHYETFFKNARN
jgi:hypothetical protein